MSTLNGPQTTGRAYRNLSEPRYASRSDLNAAIAVRDGTTLLADIHRPDAQGRFPALLAASPYPRQMQDFGAPAGFIEAGVTDFWVPRGYVHVIANLRGTCGSGGTFNFLDAQERRDVHDLVEWVGRPALVRRKRRHDRHRLLRHDPDRGGRRARRPRSTSPGWPPCRTWAPTATRST